MEVVDILKVGFVGQLTFKGGGCRAVDILKSGGWLTFLKVGYRGFFHGGARRQPRFLQFGIV